MCNDKKANTCCVLPIAKILKMDKEYEIDDKLKRKRELTLARVKKHRIKKRNESLQLNAMKKKQVKENNIERKRLMSKLRSRRYREKKRLDSLKSIHVDDSQIPGPSHTTHTTFTPLTHTSVLRSQQLDDPQIDEISTDTDDPLAISENDRTIHDSQIAGTSKNMFIPLVMPANSGNLNANGENLLPPIKEEPVDDDLEPLEDQVCKIDEEYKIDDKLKRKRELTNARVKKYRKKKRKESEDDPTEEIQNKQIKDINVETKKTTAKEGSKRSSGEKHIDVLQFLEIRMETD